MTFMAGALVGAMAFLISLAAIMASQVMKLERQGMPDARERLRQWYGEMPALAFLIQVALLFLWAAAGGFLAMGIF